jgi:hypothetical protein
LPKRVLPLTELQVRNAKPRDKVYSLADGGGMYLEVKPRFPDLAHEIPGATGHFAAIDTDELPALLEALDRN